MKILKCPKTDQINTLKNCLSCNCLIQIHDEHLECEIDWKKHVTNLYNPNDLKIAEL